MPVVKGKMKEREEYHDKRNPPVVFACGVGDAVASLDFGQNRIRNLSDVTLLSDPTMSFWQLFGLAFQIEVSRVWRRCFSILTHLFRLFNFL